MRIIKFITSIDNYKNNLKINLFNIWLILICILIIYLSNTYFLNLDIYYIYDFLASDFHHNVSLNKNFLNVIPNYSHIFGTSTWIIEPSLNFLSRLNYNLSSKNDYLLYLVILRLLEILLIFALLFLFSTKLKIKDLTLSLFLYVILLVNFSRYDHESYMVFPILIFVLFHAISVRLNNAFFFFLSIFIGNLWSYLINPIYFFNTCFFPLIFIYGYFLYFKKFKKLLTIFLINLPFSSHFILMSFGSSRIALPDLHTGALIHQNFALFTSKGFLFISVIFFILAINNIFKKKKNFFCWFFVIYVLILSLIGVIYKFQYNSWRIPSPYQFEYSLQYLLILTFYKIIKCSEKNFILTTSLIALFLYFIYMGYYFTHNHNKDIFLSKNININPDEKRVHFWTKKQKTPFAENLKYKRVYVDLPTFGSDYHEKTDKIFYQDEDFRALRLVKNFNESPNLTWMSFWENNIVINKGNSYNLDINSLLAHYFNTNTIKILDKKWGKEITHKIVNGKIYLRHETPYFDFRNFEDFYKIDYVISDILFDKNFYKHINLIKTYQSNQYNIYLYSLEKKNNDTKIEQINIIRNYNSYAKEIKNFKNKLSISEKYFNKVAAIKEFCQIEIIHKNNQIQFNVKNPNPKICLAVFPVPFSHNNFFEKKNEVCETFRVQFYYHGCIINIDSTYILKKKNLFLYAFNSFKDYLDFNELSLNFNQND